MKRTILLAGPSAAGKSTLARALAKVDSRFVVSTSAHLRSISGAKSPSELFVAGKKLDQESPSWLCDVVRRQLPTMACVVDAIRSHEQHNSFGSDAVRVNVVADDEDLPPRHALRGTSVQPTYFMFNRPDFVWNSSRCSLGAAVQGIQQLAGGGAVDVLIGGQFGSEGKGKLAALLAPMYQQLVRSGGPNAGHWVRTDRYEYCFHHLPSGTLANTDAGVVIAAGATLYPPRFWEEVGETGCADRLVVDRNTVLIDDEDRSREASKLVGEVGSTAQGCGSAHARRVLRGLDRPVAIAGSQVAFQKHLKFVSDHLFRRLQQGDEVMLEGTQGSQLSLFHGPYPFTTSRDTNVSGLLSEVGIPPCFVRNTWMVVRSHPIRVGGNSGPMENEIGWEDVAVRAGRPVDGLKVQELTSTTKRQRRVGEFSWSQFADAVNINRPTHLFLTFADYIHPAAAGVTDMSKLPDPVLDFVHRLEQESGVPVVGISTGRHQDQTVMHWGHL